MATVEDRETEPAMEKRGSGSNGEHEEGQEVAERLAWFLASRVDGKGKLRTGLLAKASAQKRQRERAALDGEAGPAGDAGPPSPPGGVGTLNWTPIGPSEIARGQATGNPPVSGRISAIALHPNGNRCYLATANGGIWFSADGGASWVPKDDYSIASPLTSGLDADSLAAGGLDVRFAATGPANDLIFVGTGEANGNIDAYFGIGVLTSTDGGSTWTREALNLSGRGVFRILIDPTSTAAQPPVLAATTTGLWSRPTGGAVTSWTQVTSSAFANSNGRVCALIADLVGTTRTYYAAFWGDSTVYQSLDGTTWTAIAGLPASPGRISLAARQGVVYALVQNGALYRLSGGSFQLVASTPPASGFVGSQGWYDLVVEVDPTNSSTVYLAGGAAWDGSDWSLGFFRASITGGPGSFSFGFNPANNANPAGDPTWIGRGVHSDAHAMAFATDTSGTAVTEVWVGTDGGPFRSTTVGAPNGSFQPRQTGLAISQMTFLAERSDMDSVVFAGSQDNGTLRCLGEPAWFEAPEGDGGAVAMDPNNRYRLMRQYVRASLSLATDGGQTKGSWASANFPPNGNATENGATGFYAPMAVAPAGGTTMLAFGTNRLWLTTDWGGSWTTLPTNTNPYASSPPDLAQDVLSGGSVTTIAFASATTIFAATATSVYRFDLAGGAWTRTGPLPGLPAGAYVTDLAADSGSTVYAVLGGSGVDHVWFYDGATFQTAGGTPGLSGLTRTDLDIPMHAVATDPGAPGTVFVGSDVGCWKGTKSGASWSWTPFSSGLPECAITDLSVNNQSRLLRAATHGRGVWEIPIASGATASGPDLYMRVNYADTGRVPGGSRYPWVEGAQDPTRPGFNVYHWMSADIKVRRPDWPPSPDSLGTPPDYLDFAVNIDDYVSSVDTETAVAPASLTPAQSNRVFVQVHNRSLTAVPGASVRVLLLVTPVSAGLPALPAGYATHIQNGDPPGSPNVAGSGWLYGSQWYAADPASPYKSPPSAVDVRTPGVVEFSVDFKNIPAAALTDHVCAAAFITTAADPLTSTEPSLDMLTMHDKHAVHRNLHLVAAGATPAPGGGGFSHSPMTIALDFHNATEEHGGFDIVFERSSFPGHLSVMLTKVDRDVAVSGFEPVGHDKLEPGLRSHVGRWLERAGGLVEAVGERIELAADRIQGEDLPPDELELPRRRLDGLDRSRVFVADDAAKEPTIERVPIPSGGFVTAVVNLRAPQDARPGDHYRFNIVQRREGALIGGSTYVYAIVADRDQTAAS